MFEAFDVFILALGAVAVFGCIIWCIESSK